MSRILGNPRTTHLFQRYIASGEQHSQPSPSDLPHVAPILDILPSQEDPAAKVAGSHGHERTNQQRASTAATAEQADSLSPV